LKIAPLPDGVYDVLVARHFGIQHDDTGMLIQYQHEKIQLDNHLFVGRIPDIREIMNACTPKGYHRPHPHKLWQPTPQFGAYYAIVLAIDSNEYDLNWDSDGAILRLVAASRYVHSTALGFGYAARLVQFNGQIKTIMPFPGNHAYMISNKPVEQQRHWLKPDEWREAFQLASRLPNSKAHQYMRIKRAMRTFELTARESELSSKFELLARSAQCLVGSKPLKQGLQLLAHSVNVQITESEINAFYTVRSRVTHGAGLPLPRLSENPQDLSDIAKKMEKPLAAYDRIETVLRRVFSRLILEDSFAAHFESHETVEKWMESGKVAATVFTMEDPLVNDANWRSRIICDPQIHHGEPCVRGTRVAVSVLVASLADLTIDELLKQYPQLSREDIQAALLFASEAAHTTMVA